ncbi:MAG: phosphatidate cytidylyltransferase [Lachnospiraceae bacterium]|jgi:phosphatidate cytidylyltransferase|nr:phosphatidate cytidylyltransferase [Lachnospiraceae bacterium]MCR5320999.1 phosphatidate cytidylyltransferase [Lachnospiraceae bacterium]
MFWKRLGSGVVLIIIALVTLILGGPLLDVTVFLISLVGYTELMKALGVAENKKNAMYLVGVTGICAWYVLIFLGNQFYEIDTFFTALLVILLVFFGCMFLYVFQYPKRKAWEVEASLFSFLYAPFMLSFIDLTRNLQHGKEIVWLIFISSWGCDTCAYCVGMLCGKHKMTPLLSPKKTIEGALGGIVGAGLLGLIYGAVLSISDAGMAWYSFGVPFAMIGAIGAMISMVGDLAASAIKREHEIKDYGTLIPGHGGIMDRFDSVIFTAPAVYFLACLVFRNFR